MEDLQPECLRPETLRGFRRGFCRPGTVVLFASFISALGAIAEQHIPAQPPLAIPHVRSGRATLRQEGRTTMFLLTSKDGTVEKVALTHPSEYRQGLNAPFAARVVAEIPGQLLIFTDTFASNPGNAQGRCSASETGERFLHVVSLTAPLRESLSVLVESCLLEIEPKSGSPSFDPTSRTLTLQFDSDNGQPTTKTYHIAPDNSVTQ